MGFNFFEFKEKVDEKEIENLEKRFEGQESSKNIPAGVYPVKLTKMEVAKSSWGADQININFKIEDGPYKGSTLFYNGTFDGHFAHGLLQTAKLISEMTDGEVDKYAILKRLDRGPQSCTEYILDLFQAISAQVCFDLDYEVKESKKINAWTKKPYVNKLFSIKEVFDI